jgi:glycerate kinase
MTCVPGPLGDAVAARWGMMGTVEDQPRTAVIEMAAASGMALLDPARRNPTRTSSCGTGQLIAAAMDRGAARIILGIGGSATNDGGCGAAAQLGVRFLDATGVAVEHPVIGGGLKAIDRIDLSGLDPRIGRTQIVVACDVSNPMTGPNGAAHVYGPQKGANSQQVAQLDEALCHLAELIRRQLGRDVQTMPGAGAAGGMGGGMVAMLGARLEPGIHLVLDAVGFDRRVADCDLCLTGEGRLDGQSLSGKACLGVARAAARHGVRTVALVGSIGSGAERTIEEGIAAYHAIGSGLSVDESIRRAAELLRQTTSRVVRSEVKPS